MYAMCTCACEQKSPRVLSTTGGIAVYDDDVEQARGGIKRQSDEDDHVDERPHQKFGRRDAEGQHSVSVMMIMKILS